MEKGIGISHIKGNQHQDEKELREKFIKNTSQEQVLSPEISEQNTNIINDLNKKPALGFVALRLQKLQQNLLKLQAILAHSLENELLQGLGFLLFPCFLGSGILVYFALPREPSFIALSVALILFFALSKLKSNLPKLAAISSLIGLLVFGTWVAKLHSDIRQPKMLKHQLTSKILGKIIKREIKADDSARYWIAVKTYDGKIAQNLPDYIRVTARKNHAIGDIGNQISGLVRLRAPSSPILPQNYDFAFHGYFEGLGGIGFFMGKPKFKPVESPFNFHRSLMQLRAHLRHHIESLLPNKQAGLVVALITGDRSGILEADNQVLRQSGLAHILAISGLHMALLAGTLFFFLRSLLALSPYLIAHFPIKKWAAMAALIAASFYFLISGAGIATQRAYIMLVVMLLAILVNRKALTLRNVALAAIVVLIISPHAIVNPGFQMSFAAVVALIACYEFLQQLRDKRFEENSRFYEAGIIGRIWAGLWKFFIGLLTTSLIAGLTTGVFAAFHFHQVAPYGLLANILAMPIVTLMVMPLALIGVLLMPFALDEPFFYLMGQSVEWVLKIAQWVETIQPIGTTGALPLMSIGFFSLALLWFAMFKTRLKWASLIFFALFIPTLFIKSQPLALISEDAKVIGVIEADKLHLLHPKRGRFLTDNWAKAFNLNPSKDAKFSCDDLGCIYRISPNLIIALAKSGEAMVEDCKHAQIIIHQRRNLPSCENPKILEISYHALERQGTHVIYQKGDSFIIKTAYGRFKRPWTAHRY